jgi:integrase
MDGFDNAPLASIDARHVRAWANSLVAKGLSPSTVRAIYSYFVRIMRAAVAAGLLAAAPVGKGVVDLPESQRRRERFLTEDELERLAQSFDPYHRPLIYTAAYTGCRWGELTGLLRDNLRLKERELHVRTVAAREGGKVRIKSTPKTDSAWRTVSLPAHLAEMLTFHLASAPASGVVFPGPDGGALTHTNFRRRYWLPAVAEANLEPLSFHDLRHTHTTWLIHAGWQEFRIVRRLGWKDATMLHRVYGHEFPHGDSELVEALDQSFRRATNQGVTG